ncbi:MAG TPA: GTPase, partial [Gammaproteobacteria bacterium]|nr:GTPase [Gammaproteobacteria bacterium]
ESFENLADNAARVGLDFERLPLVVQFNKRDLPETVSEEEVLKTWSRTHWPVFFGAALRGDGVRETFDRLLREVYRSLDQGYGLRSRHQVDESRFVGAVIGGEGGTGG